MKLHQKGAALVELALIIPLLLTMALIATEFGRAIYQYNLVAKSLRDAARYLSLQTPGTHQTEAGNLIVYGNVAGTGAPLAIGLTTANVSAPTWQVTGSNPVINTVTVQISGYVFQPMIGNVFGLNFANINFGPINATMRSSI